MKLMAFEGAKAQNTEIIYKRCFIIDIKWLAKINRNWLMKYTKLNLGI